MSEFNPRDLVQTSLDAFNRADWAAWKKNASPNAVFEEASAGRSYSGHSEILSALKEWRKAFPDLKGRVQEQYVTGNTVISEVMWTGTQKGELATPTGVIPPSNREVRLSAVMISRVQDGKIVSTREWFDFFQMLQQIDALPALKTRKAGA